MRDFGGKGSGLPAHAADGQKHVLYCATEAIQKPPGEGWRVEVNLRMGRYRWVRRYGRKLERTPYRPLSELPPERVERARAESARQRRLKRQ